MNYLFLIVSVLLGIRGYTFACWLWTKDNRLGAVGVSILIVVNLLLPIYHIINAG